jgi:2-C-methyl-D-erythritol 4-phosphate cytidylyltransferase
MTEASHDEAAGIAVAVVLCAGQGTRMGAAGNKVFLPLAGKPLLAYTLAAFERADTVDDMLLVAHPTEVEFVRAEIVARHPLAKVAGVIAGGATRHQSEENALAALRPRIEAGAIGIVLIHDGARPCVRPDDIDTLVRAARECGGALLGTPVGAEEVIARIAGDGTLGATYPAGDLWRAQTPQAFAARALLAAYDLARRDGFDGTDTAASYERLGRPVQMVRGHADNIKVTTPEDLIRAAAILADRAHGDG